MHPVLYDKDACTSAYGMHTISIRIVAVKKSLFILAHEFGHVKYQAPNIQSYREYYTEFYLANTYKSTSMGHNDKDPSGRLALDFTKKFRVQYLNFAKLQGGKVVSHMVRLQQIKDQMRKTGWEKQLPNGRCNLEDTSARWSQKLKVSQHRPANQCQFASFHILGDYCAAGLSIR